MGGFGMDERQLRDAVDAINAIAVTTENISRPYEIIGPVYFQTTNRGFWFNSPFRRLSRLYRRSPWAELLAPVKPSPGKKIDEVAWMSRFDLRGGFENSVGSKHFDRAFYIAVAELRRRAFLAGGHALIGFRCQNWLDTNQYACFYLQTYATAVKFT